MNLYRAQRALALIVGVLLAFCSLVVFPLAHFALEGSNLQVFGEKASILWALHGWAFMIYVVASFMLARRAGWSPQFTVLVLAAGLIPLLIFWVEHKVTQKLRAEQPQLVEATARS